jgi:hypothetical protein
MSMTSESFASQERAAFEPLNLAVSAILAEPVVRSGGEQSTSPSAFSPSERAELLRRMVATEEKTVALIKAYASGAARSGDAARKAAAWGITGTIMTSIVVVIIAIIVTVFTYGSSSLGAAAAALEAQLAFLSVAARAGHPLAGELAAILKQLAAALSDFSRERERDHRAAVTQVLAEVDGTMTGLERLPGRAASIPGSCQGDPRAVFEGCSALDAALARFDVVLQQLPRRDADAVSLISAVATVRRTLADSIPTLALKT